MITLEEVAVLLLTEGRSVKTGRGAGGSPNSPRLSCVSAEFLPDTFCFVHHFVS